jgi:Cys-tRNA(Pro)/Cys-tRNA(Cys) deacylase
LDQARSALHFAKSAFENSSGVLTKTFPRAVNWICPAMKTNAARLLDALGISYELRDYEVDPEDLSAESVARKIGLPLEQVFKTLVARGDRTGVLLAVVPGDAELDLKALARLSGDRKTDVVALKEVQPLTGYIRGGVTALGARKDYPVFVDETLELFDVVSVSAGVRGTQILLAPGDYLRALGGRVAVGPIGRSNDS